MDATQGGGGNRRKILVVDDEAIVLDLMVDLLIASGFSVVGTVSANEALRKTRTDRFDGMVLDLYMPEMPGMLLHAKVKVQNPDLARNTLFVSGHFTRDELRREMESSAHFLPKPFTPEELAEAVRKMFEPTEQLADDASRRAAG